METMYTLTPSSRGSARRNSDTLFGQLTTPRVCDGILLRSGDLQCIVHRMTEQGESWPIL